MIQTKIQREYIAARSAEEKMGYPCPEISLHGCRPFKTAENVYIPQNFRIFEFRTIPEFGMDEHGDLGDLVELCAILRSTQTFFL